MDATSFFIEAVQGYYAELKSFWFRFLKKAEKKKSGIKKGIAVCDQRFPYDRYDEMRVNRDYLVCICLFIVFICIDGDFFQHGIL